MMFFTAIEIPAMIADELEGLKNGLPNARWIARESTHLTLAYIGKIEADWAAEIDEQLAETSKTPFQLQLSGVGAFGGNRPRAIWAGVAASTQLADLQSEIAGILARAGVKSERRKYTPHVTLARLRGTRVPTVATYLARYAGYESAAFEVERFVMMSSRPFKGGGPYITECAYPLNGGLGEYRDDFEATW